MFSFAHYYVQYYIDQPKYLFHQIKYLLYNKLRNQELN